MAFSGVFEPVRITSQYRIPLCTNWPVLAIQSACF